MYFEFSRKLLGLAAAGLVLGSAAVAADSPGASKAPLRIVVGYPPGQTTDSIARQYATALSQELGRSVIVDNRAGANGILGAMEVKRSAPDGNTILFATSGQLAINPSLYKKLPYEPLKDFEPLALVFTGPLYLLANPGFAAKTRNTQELIALAKAEPGRLNYGSGGQGITAHLGMELFQAQAGVRLNHVPYKGSPAALTDLIGGQIDVMFELAPSAMPFVKSGKLKVFGVSSLKRDPRYPDVPTLDEQGLKDFEAAAWVAVVLPKGTPEAIAESLHAALERASRSPQLQQGLQNIGVETKVGSRDELARLLPAETVKWAKAVEITGAKLD